MSLKNVILKVINTSFSIHLSCETTQNFFERDKLIYDKAAYQVPMHINKRQSWDKIMDHPSQKRILPNSTWLDNLLLPLSSPYKCWCIFQMILCWNQSSWGMMMKPRHYNPAITPWWTNWLQYTRSGKMGTSPDSIVVNNHGHRCFFI